MFAKFYVIFQEKSVQRDKNGLFWAGKLGFRELFWRIFEPEYVKNLKNYIEIDVLAWFSM
jgi:hypothetical protein